MSTILLAAFPLLILVLTYLFFFILNILSEEPDIHFVNEQFIASAPFFLGIVAIWFLIAWLSHSSIIRSATHSKPLDRKENKRVYNLLENLCISRGISMPKLYIIDDDSLNAFATGLGKNSYSISLSKGIIAKLDDDELEAVIAHELTHIMNRDVRLLVVSIIFVGIFAFLSSMAFRMLLYGRRGRSNSKDNSGAIMIIVMILAFIGYGLAILFKFALSRKREYLADAGAVELTKNAPALANALRKIKGDPFIEAVKNEDVAQMFIEHPTMQADEKSKQHGNWFSRLFATHPPIEKRIEILEQI